MTRRPDLSTRIDRNALARGWLIYLAVMLVFVGLTALVQERPVQQTQVSMPALTAPIGGKFAHQAP